MTLYGTRQLADGMRAVREATLRIADDIPESHYHYRPTPESRSVAETLVHIAWLASFDRFVHEEAHLDSLEAIDFGAVIQQSRAEERRRRSKAEIIDLLRTEGDRWVRWVERQPDALLAERVRLPDGASTNRFEMLLGTKEHEMHHRAQLTVLQRLLGVVPHTSRDRPPRDTTEGASATAPARATDTSAA
ncbi:MAG TPA: DinB family protein [Gemmatimonadaceae bacterium]|nr:DinB family protein [Gemmatimonadaceae bacterium]